MCLPVALSVAHWERGKKTKAQAEEGTHYHPQWYSTMTDWWGKAERKGHAGLVVIHPGWGRLQKQQPPNRGSDARPTRVFIILNSY